MEVFEAIRTVLATRNYRDTPLPQDIIRRIVEAGRLTASSRNGQPWHFIIVEDRATIKKLSEQTRSSPYVSQAVAAIVVAVDKSSTSGRGDAGRAVQSMVLTAWAEGVGSNWCGTQNQTEVRALLGIPEEFEIHAVVPLGYPTKPSHKGKKNRKPMSQVAHRGRFGQSFA
ncbi:MAG: nitroreductase [Dehalococcoidia bacterium]|nr:nitroreductase [Dehalococcoidia bacterium]